MKGNNMNENKTLLLDNDYGYTEIGYAKDLFNSLWSEISEYIDNNEYCASSMIDHFEVLAELEDIIEEETDNDDRKVYQLTVENGYPSLSVLESRDVKEKEVLRVYICDRGGRFTVNCPELDLFEHVDAENVFYCLNDFTNAHKDRDVVIRCID